MTEWSGLKSLTYKDYADKMLGSYKRQEFIKGV